MVVHASEKEQVEALRGWWKENGSSLITGVLLGLAVLLGFKAWQGYQEKQALSASNTYAQMLAAAGSEPGAQAPREQVQALANELITNHSGSTYAVLAALMLARQAVDGGELPAAQAQLQWAIEHADSEEIRQSARVRLIRLLIDQENYTEAEQRLGEIQDAGAYAYQFSELRGDLAVARGDQSAAAAAYRQALDQLPTGAPNRALLTAKFENVGGSANSGNAP